MLKPCISVIVPVYNTEKYLKDCINSILTQTFNDLELILIDDGSTDNSGVICDEYAKLDARVRVFHQENRGVSTARNVGIDNALGEYITFVDADDYIVNNALEILYNDIVNNKADISYAGGVKVYESATEALEKAQFKIWQGDSALRESLMGNYHTNSACRKLYNKEFIGTIRFEDGRKIHEDGFFLFCCFLKKPTVFIRNVCVYRYRNNPESASKSAFSDKFFDVLHFAERKKELITEYFPEYEAEMKNMLVRANLIMLQLLCKTNDKKYKKDIRKCIKKVKKLKKYYIAKRKTDKRFFVIVIYNLYTFYRIYHNFKYKRK